MKKNYPHLAARLYGAPLLVHPDKAAVIERVFQAHIMGDRVIMMEDEGGETPEQRAERDHARRQRAYAGIALQRRDDKPYAITTTGIALVPVMGTLIQRGTWMDSMSGLTGYDEVGALVNDAASDPAVRGVVLEIDSPGGEANGAFELAGKIIAAASSKPVWAHANEVAYSAAYLIACAADRVYAPLTGGVGSIGTLAMHLDQSKRDAMMGYTYTMIHAGARKIDGNSHQPLANKARARIQSEVDRVNELFLSHVAQQRSLSVEAVAATEAGLLSPPEALDAGFINGVAILAETVALLESEIGAGGSSVSTGTRLAADHPSITINVEVPMTDKTAADQPKYTEAQLEAARTEARTAAFAEGRADGIKAERERGKDILTCEEAKGRGPLAFHLACETDTAADAAKKILAATPVEQAGLKGGPLATAMANLKNPKVGADGGEEQAPAAGARLNAAAIYEKRRVAH